MYDLVPIHLKKYTKYIPKETTAAISKIISVISCKASQTNWRNVLGGFGGIVLDPNTSLLASRSDLSPRVPK